MAAGEHYCKYRKQLEKALELLASYQARLEEQDSHTRALESRVLELRGQVDGLQRHVFGPRTERMPTINEELRKERRGQESPPDRSATQEKRRENRARKNQIIEERVDYVVAEAEKTCPKCGGTEFSRLGKGKQTTVIDYVPGHLVKRVVVQETLACRCGECILTARAPSKVVEQGKYGAGFMAHVVLRKCGDQNPIYRLEKDFKRLGIPVARSTMNDLFHRAAEVTRPLSKRIIELVAASEIVHADETPVRIQAKKKCRRGFAWTFIARPDAEAEQAPPTLVTYRFSKSRSGQTPGEVLGSSTGTLVVDAFTGYNRVTQPEGRQRAGCLAHARRKFFEALSAAPIAQQALDLILDVYRVEHDAVAEGVAGTDQHAAMRHDRSRVAMDKLHVWLLQEQGLHPPRSKLGKAITYALNNWDRLIVFLADVRLPPDNNMAERQLRPIAIGRKNWLFVGSPEAGENLCGLHTLISTCEANDVNPWEYLKDVLERIGDHPARQLDELLPHRWTPANAA